MGRYRDGWLLVTAVTATVGVWSALRTWPVVGVLGAFVGAALIGFSLAALSARESGRERIRSTVACGVGAGVTAVAAVGLLALFGTPGLVVVVVMASGCPGLWEPIRRWRASRPGQARSRGLPEPPPDPGLGTFVTMAGEVAEHTPDMPSEPRLLDDYALCCAWRRSYVILKHSHPPETHLRVVQQRQLYLDELEQRNPAGLAAWLASGARAASDPTRFIVHRQR